MSVLDAISQRRSVKHYDPDFTLPPDALEKIIQASMFSPTSYNIQHWRFLRVTDPSVRAELRAAAWGQQQVVDASELIILCADTQAWSDQPERYWRNASKETRETLVSRLTAFYQDNPQLQRDEAIRSCGIAAQTMMLSAKALGLDTGAMVGFDPDKVAQIVRLPDTFVIGLMLVIGKAKEAAKPRGGQLPIEEVWFENQFV